MWVVERPLSPYASTISPTKLFLYKTKTIPVGSTPNEVAFTSLTEQEARNLYLALGRHFAKRGIR